MLTNVSWKIDSVKIIRPVSTHLEAFTATAHWGILEVLVMKVNIIYLRTSSLYLAPVHVRYSSAVCNTFPNIYIQALVTIYVRLSALMEARVSEQKQGIAVPVCRDMSAYNVKMVGNIAKLSSRNNSQILQLGRCINFQT